MRSLRVRSRAKRKGLNRQARKKLVRSAALHLAAAKLYQDVAVLAQSKQGTPGDGTPWAKFAVSVIGSLSTEATVKGLSCAASGIGALVAAKLVGRRPKAPMWWGGSDAN